jgi:hypothetical protein
VPQQKAAQERTAKRKRKSDERSAKCRNTGVI